MGGKISTDAPAREGAFTFTRPSTLPPPHVTSFSSTFAAASPRGGFFFFFKRLCSSSDALPDLISVNPDATCEELKVLLTVTAGSTRCLCPRSCWDDRFG